MARHREWYRTKLGLALELWDLSYKYEELLHENLKDKEELISLKDELIISRWLKDKYENKYNDLIDTLKRTTKLIVVSCVLSIVLFILVTTR